MTWNNIPGNKYWEYDDNPSDPGGAQSDLWDKQFDCVRTNTYSEIKLYTKCRRIGTTVDTAGELNKTYHDNIFKKDNNLTSIIQVGLNWINLDWII